MAEGYETATPRSFSLTLDHFQSLSVIKAAKDKIADENNIIQAQKGVVIFSIITVLTGSSLVIINLVWRVTLSISRNGYDIFFLPFFRQIHV